MKQFLNKIMSLLMAFVVLLSTMSFTINMHYCGGTLVDTAIFKNAKTCGMEMQKSTTNVTCSITENDCCNDKQINIDGQDELQLSFDSLSLDQQLFITAFVYSNFFERLEKKLNSYRDYIPPLVIKSIYKLDETYLI